METYPPTIFNHLDQEWEHLLNGRRLDRALARWRGVQESLTEFRRVRELLDRLEDQTADPERQSEVLLALLRLAPADELAARLVLQRFIPPLKSIAGWKQPLRQTDWAAMIVSAAHEVIVTYPVDRRPQRVAANIVWDVRKRMYAALTDHRRWMEALSLGEPDEDALVAPDIAERFEAADLLRWAGARCQVPREVARLIVLTRGAGFQIEEIAAHRAVPSARLRQRRWRCEQRMREALALS
jgi:hypothetical protein